MPPRRKKRTAPPAAAGPREPPVPADGGPENPDTHPDEEDEDGNQSQDSSFSIFNTTFSLYRLSPLYINKGLQPPTDPKSLQILSRRLRDTLVGDVVRGVQVGLENDASLGRAGALEKVEWYWTDVQRLMDGRAGEEVIDDDESRNGLCLDIRYENADYNAILVPDISGDPLRRDSSPDEKPLAWTWQESRGEDDSHTDNNNSSAASFIHLPLLLLRMPAPLKSVIADFLSSTFDTRVAPLRVGTRTLVSSWERWLADSGFIGGDSGGGGSSKALVKDVVLTLGFHLDNSQTSAKSARRGLASAVDGGTAAKSDETIPAGLKTLDVVVPASEVEYFVGFGSQTSSGRKRGATDDPTSRDLKRKKGENVSLYAEEGWAWRTYPAEDNNTSPESAVDSFTTSAFFTEALATYLSRHLALDMFHPCVRVRRIACDGFVLGQDKLKIFFPSPALGSSRDGEVEKGNSSVGNLMRNLVRKAKGQSWGREVVGLVGQSSTVA